MAAIPSERMRIFSRIPVPIMRTFTSSIIPLAFQALFPAGFFPSNAHFASKADAATACPGVDRTAALLHRAVAPHAANRIERCRDRVDTGARLLPQGAHGNF